MQLFSAVGMMFLIFDFFAHENMKKPASKIAHNWLKSFVFINANRSKSQFLFHKNLPPRDFSIMTLAVHYLI